MDRSMPFLCEKLRTLLQCPRCRTSPMSIPIYTCQNGHVVCNTCYEEMTDGPQEESSLCVVCFSELTSTRNLMAEQMVQSVGRHVLGPSGNGNGCGSGSGNHVMTAATKPNFLASGVNATSCSSTISCTELPGGGATSSSEEDNRIISPSELDMLSHRPIRCPKAPCTSTVAVASLTAHFTFDHPDVPLLTVDPGVTSHLWLSPATIPLEMSRCVALLLVSGRCRKSSKSISNLTPSMAKYYNRTPLPLMTSRTRLIGDRSESMNGSGDGTEDATVLIWVSDVDSSVKYTLEVYNGQNPERSISSTCPVVSLRESQTPKSIYRRGDAVILHPAFTSAITQENGGFDISIKIL